MLCPYKENSKPEPKQFRWAAAEKTQEAGMKASATLTKQVANGWIEVWLNWRTASEGGPYKNKPKSPP